MKASLEELTRLAGVPVFHLKDGLFAFRMREHVHLLVAAAPRDDAPIIREVVVDCDGFASLIAFLSEKHEDRYTWLLAKALLGEGDGHDPAKQGVVATTMAVRPPSSGGA